MNFFLYFIITCFSLWGLELQAQDDSFSISDLDAIESDMNFDFASDFEDIPEPTASDPASFLNAQPELPADEMLFENFEDDDEVFFQNPPLDSSSSMPENTSELGMRTLDNDVAPIVQLIETPNLFAGAPPIPGTLRILANGEAPEEYRVKMGDTLFDICDQLIDEPGYWPKLWALNPYIRNPHFIYPGMVLRFYPGNKETPPFLQVVLEDDMVPIDRGQLTEDELLQQDISGLLTRAEVMDQTPVIGADEITAFPEMDEAFLLYGSLFEPREIKVTVPAFFFADKLEPLGIVIGGTSGSILIDRDQDLVVRKEGNLNTNTAYSIVRYTGAVDHPKTGRLVGYRYEFIAQVQLQEQIEGKLIAGKVLLNRAGVQPGDLVIPYQAVRRTVPLYATGKNGDGQAVIGFEEPFLNLGGRGSFVFLETKDRPVQVGEALFIFQNVQRAAPTFNATQLPEFRQQIATAYIIEGFGPAAVGYILEDRREVRIGDDTGS